MSFVRLLAGLLVLVFVPGTPVVAAAATVPDATVGPAPARPDAASFYPPSLESVAAAPGLGLAGIDRSVAIDCVAKAIGYEAGHEPEAGQRAVAQVILNRLRHPAFPKTVCGVVFQGSARRTGCQFTFTCDGALRKPLSRRVHETALRLAAEAVDGAAPATVGAATHYHANYVSPRWAPALVRVGSIGAHIFYRFPGASGAVSALLAAARAGSGGRTAGAPLTTVVFSVWGLTTATLSSHDGQVTPR